MKVIGANATKIVVGERRIHRAYQIYQSPTHARIGQRPESRRGTIRRRRDAHLFSHLSIELLRETLVIAGLFAYRVTKRQQGFV